MNSYMNEQKANTVELVRGLANNKHKGKRGRSVEGADGKKYQIEDEIPGQGGGT